MHADNQNIFVMRAIKNGDFAPSRSRGLNTPEKVVSELFLGRLLEVCNTASVGIHRAYDMPDDSILAAGIKGLKNNEQRALSFRKQALLKIAHLQSQVFDFLQRFVLVVFAPVARIEITQANVISRSYAKVFDETLSGH